MDEHRGARVEAGDRARDEGRPVDAAADNPRLRRIRPALADRLSGEVDDRVDAGEPFCLYGAGRRVPGDLALGSGRATDERDDLVPGVPQGGYERRADEPGRAGDGDLHD